MTANIIKGLLPDGHAPSVLKQEIKDMIKAEAPAADLTKLATKAELADVRPTAEAVAKVLGLWPVRGDSEPAQTMHGVPVVWIDTSNPSAYVPPAPVFSQQKKDIEIPSSKFATYKLNGNPVGAGTHRAEEPYPRTVSVTAEPAGGATFAVGAVTAWAFTFEAQAIAYEDAILPLTSYYRLDDAPGTKRPRDRGTSPLTIFADLNDSVEFGGASVGVGATSLTVKKGGQHWAQFAPASVTAFTWVAALQWKDGVGVTLRLGGSQTGEVPAFRFATQGDNNTLVPAGFDGKNVGATTTAKPTPQPSDGDKVLIGYTWDGSTLRGYVNGELLVSAPWAGSKVASELIKPMAWGAAAGKTWSLAGVGFQNGEAKSAEWFKAAYEALKKG